MNTVTLILIISALTILRFGAVFALQFLAETAWAQKTIFPPQAGREKRRYQEMRFYIYSLLIEAVILFFLIKFSIFRFNDTTILGALVLLGGFVLIVEPLYYLYHRLLHVKFLFKHHHRHHHQTVVPEPVSAFYFTWSERLSYTALFVIPLLLASFLGLLSVPLLMIYAVTFDFINALGHTNAKIFPAKYSDSVWCLFFYNPEFHSGHHQYIHTNYSLFMPIWDKLLGTHRKVLRDE